MRVLDIETRFALLHDPRYLKAQIDVNPATTGENFGGWADELGDGSLAGGRSASDTGAPVTDPATRAEDDAFLSEVLSEVTERSLRAPALGPTEDGGWDAELSGDEEDAGGDRGELPGTGARVGRMRDLLSGSLGPEQMGEGIAIFRAALAEARSCARREAAA